MNPFGEDDEQNEDHKSDVSSVKAQEFHNASLNEVSRVVDSSNSSLTSHSGLSSSTPAIPHAVEASTLAKTDTEVSQEYTNDKSSKNYRSSVRRYVNIFLIRQMKNFILSMRLL